MKIVKISTADEKTCTAIQKLLPQLSTQKPSFSMNTLKAMLASPETILLAAKQTDGSDNLIGMLTLTIFQIPTGLKAHIDDVVVDESIRGKGIGQKLMEHAIELCKEMGIQQIGLTSHPRREAANRLYQRLGFKRFETNVYVYKI